MKCCPVPPRQVTETLGDTDPTFDSLHERQMPFLNGVVYESLRLHPPVYVHPPPLVVFRLSLPRGWGAVRIGVRGGSGGGWHELFQHPDLFPHA